MREWSEDQPGDSNETNARPGSGQPDASLYDTSWRNEWQLDRLAALVRDPTTIFLYWEVSDSRKGLICEHFQSSWSSLPFELAVHGAVGGKPIPDSAPLVQKAVAPQQSRAYVSELQPGGVYIVDLTTRTIHGQPFTILRSDPVVTPPLPDLQCGGPRALFAKVGEQRAGLRLRGLRMTDSLTIQTVLGKDPAAPYAEQFDGYTVRTPGGGAGV
ncbi:MAG: DUF4912 domain-containing protein [Bacilli bacterium]